MDKGVSLKINMYGFSEQGRKRLKEPYAAYAAARMAFISYSQKVMGPDFTLERGGRS